MYDTRDGQFKYRFEALSKDNTSGIIEYANSMQELCETSRAYGAFPHGRITVWENNEELFTFNRQTFINYIAAHMTWEGDNEQVQRQAYNARDADSFRHLSGDNRHHHDNGSIE